MRMLVGAVIAIALSGCASLPALVCSGAGEPKLVAQLFFGRNIGDRLGVSEHEFRRFVDAEVTPRFPDGFTMLDARGQYHDSARNRIVREPSKAILIVLGDEARDVPRLSEIAEAYRTRFRQQSVGIVTQRSCASF